MAAKLKAARMTSSQRNMRGSGGGRGDGHLERPGDEPESLDITWELITARAA